MQCSDFDQSALASHPSRSIDPLPARSMSIDLTLDRICALYGLLPPYTRPTIHVAGTNGKGSVSAFLSSILGASGMSVGRYNSPHLLTVYDSIVINNASVDPETYSSCKALVESASKQHALPISSFEVLTLTALMIFEQAKVDFVVMEVGLGGRLDATNVLPDSCVAVSVLTAVDLDHQAFLGTTVAEIAKEKAAIARVGKPFVLGPQSHDAVAAVVNEVVDGDVLPALRVVPREWSVPVDGPEPPPFSLSPPWNPPPPFAVECVLPSLSEPVRARTSLRGAHQLQNLGTALGVIDALLSHASCSDLGLRQRLTAEVISAGVEATRWPGRLSFHSVRDLPVLVDGAHNPASSLTLARYLTQLLSTADPSKRISVTYVLALSHSPPKKPAETLAPLFPLALPPNVDVDVVAMGFSLPEGMPWIKCEEPGVLRDAIHGLAPGTEVKVVEAAGENGLRGVLESLAGDGDRLVVLAGSLYLVADFYRFVNTLY
ncbi:FolC bifunctional protein [Hymenopellis radicata]|nr:FolC bifunctional protein [Hymenopellis radicata]